MPTSAALPQTTLSSPLAILIIGGGLSGLTVAYDLTRLQHQSKESSKSSTGTIQWHLVESQAHLGGRIKNDDTTNRIDMGGAWIWPSQSKMYSLIRDLGLQTVRQEDAEDGRVRVYDGATGVIDGLAAKLNPESISLSATVTAVERMGSVVKVTLKHSVGSNSRENVLYTKLLVWTAPPRLSLPPHIQWNPPLSKAKMIAQQNCDTWMASVTKVAFLYEQKYWDISWVMEMKRGIYFYNEGEAFDLYDSCIEQTGDDGNVYAFTLFALIDWSRHDNTEDKQQQDERIVRGIMDQLLSIASSKRISSFQSSVTSQTVLEWMPKYKFHAIHHWPQVSSISDDPYPANVGSHPRPNPVLSQSEWKSDEGEEMLYFAGTESDEYSAGLMEGAVGSAHRVVEEISRQYHS